MSYPVTINTTEYINGAYTVSNFPFISFDHLSASDHTLVIHVTQCLNHAFAFDYITYSPSFSNLASMPSLGFTASSQRSAGLNKVTLGGIIGGSVALLLMAFACIVCIIRRRRSKKNKENSALTPPDAFQTQGPVESVFLVYTSAFLIELSSYCIFILRFKHLFACSIGRATSQEFTLD